MKVAVLVCFLTLLAYAQAYQISVIPKWGSCQGAVDPNSCSFATQTNTNPVTQTVSWGQPQAGQPQSAVSLQGPSDQSVTAGDYVLLSKIIHNNYIVDNGDLIPQSIGVSWQANLKDGNNDLGTFTFGGNLQVNETLNAPDNSVPCPYKNNWLQYGKVYTNSLPCCPFPTEADNPCSDAIIAVLNPNNNPPIEPKGTTLSFRMVIAGFCDKPTPDGCAFAQNFAFISQEQKANTKYLFGQLIVQCSDTNFCQRTASQLNGICQLGSCTAGKCDFRADPNQLGKPCTPGTGANSPCMSNFICVAGTNNTGGCQGTRIPPQQQCSNGGTNTGNVCTFYGCSNDGTACVEWPRSINSQCNNGNANTSCSSWTCQGQQGSSLPSCQANPAPQGTSCSDNIAIPNGKSAACVQKGCVGGTCSYFNANEGQTCGNPSSPCQIQVCSSGSCVTRNIGNRQTPNGCNGPDPNGNACFSRYCDGNGACTTGPANNVGTTCRAATDCNTPRCDNNGQCTNNYANVGSYCPGNWGTCKRGGCQADGTCGAFPDDGQQCSGPYTSCYNWRCSGGQCVTVAVGKTTNLIGANNCTYGGTVGPCQYLGCDGNGNCGVYYRGLYDTNPCTGSPNQCSKNGCTGNAPNCQPVPNGVTNCNDVPGRDPTTLSAGPSVNFCAYGRCNSNSLTCEAFNRADNSNCNQRGGQPVLSACQSAVCSSGSCVAQTSSDTSRCPTQTCKSAVCSGTTCTYNNRPNGTSCAGQSGVSGIDTNCQVELCNTNGECKLLTYPDYTPCPGSAPGVCRSFHCMSGKCGAGVDITQNCTYSASDPPALSQCNTFKCQLDSSCKPSPDDTLPCTRSGTPPTCMKWGCRNGTCVAVPLTGSPVCDPGASRDQCKAYTCNNGQCLGTVTPNISCNYQGTLPPCNAAFCTASGSCNYIPIPDNGSCTDNLNTCNVQVCRGGQCVPISQEGKFCNTGGDGFCFYSQCKGTVCTPIPRNENRPCAGGSANITGDAYCQTPICIAGVCAKPGSYFDNATCAVSSDKCKFNRCVRGVCDRTQDFPVPAGSDCSRGTVSECILQLCDGLGECLNTAPDSKPCYKPATNYKKRASVVPNQCQAYTCSSAVCTPSIQNVDGIPCTLNLTALNITIASPCLTGICLNAQCNPAINLNCSGCARFKSCETCLGGNYALKREADVCAINPSLPECKYKCNWCEGKCLDQDLVNSYNNFYPPGSAANLQCIGKCPVALVAEQSSSKSDALAVGLAVGLGGGFVVLAALAAAAIVLIIVVKRKLRTPDANMATTAFVSNAGANNNPVHVPSTEVKSNPTFNT